MQHAFLPQALAFLTDLAAHNDRDWFKAQQTRYETELKRPAEAFLDQLSAPLSRFAGAPVTAKLFRLHRDLRFSRDKTPYHSHLHLSWRAEDGSAWMFGLSRAYCCAGVGVMQFTKPQLGAWRNAVAAEGFVDLSAWRLDPPELKRIPAPHPQDHPQGDLLRRKGLVIWHDLPAAAQADPVASLTEVFARMEPTRQALVRALALA